MIETIIEILIIAGTLVCASLQMRKDALKARRVYAIAFVLMIAVCIAFGIAQGAAYRVSLSDVSATGAIYSPNP